LEQTLMAGGRVLVVDDDESIRELVNMALSDEGYEVVMAAEGSLALELIRTRPPDLILLDMRMPDMDGGEFAEAYRQLPGQRAPLIVLTAARDAADRAAQLEADAFLPKPFDLQALLDVVGRLAGGPAA